MPTNLTPAAQAKWAEAIGAKDPEKKLKLLREFYSAMRKHKGTEKLEKSIKRQIASLEEEVDRARSRKTGSTRQLWVVKKEGDLLIAVVGTLESSTRFFNTITKMNVEQYGALYRPVVGVMKGLGVTFQLVLAPFDDAIGSEKQERFMALMRNADALFILDVADDRYVKRLIEWFEEHDVDIVSGRLSAEIQYSSSGGIRVVGNSDFLDEVEVIKLLATYGVRKALVKVWTDATLDDVEKAVLGRVVKKVFFVVEKDAFEEGLLRRGVRNESMVKLTAKQDELALVIINRLNLIHIFTKPVVRDPVDKPVLMRRGGTVIELAEHIHRDFARNFQFARIWRRSRPLAVRVGRNFTLEDGDVVEIHAL